MANIIKIAAPDCDLTSSAQSLKSISGYDFAKEVILRADESNSAVAFVNGAFPLYKDDQPLHLEPMVNRQSQSTRYDLTQVTLGGTSGDVVHIILIDPSNVGDND